MSKLSLNLQKGLVGHWTMEDRDLSYFRDDFEQGSLSAQWNTFGTSNGNISVSNSELTIEQTGGGGGNNNMIGVRSTNLFDIGKTLRVRSKNTSNRHAAIIGLTNGGSQPYPHGSSTGNPAVTLYSREDNVSANTSYEDDDGNTGSATPPIEDYRNYRILEMRRPDSNTVEIYADGSLQSTFNIPFDGGKQVYFAADGWKTPNTIIVDWVDGVLKGYPNRGAREYNAEVRGSPTFGQSSPVGNAIDMNESSGDYFPIQNNYYTTQERLPELSVCAWVKTTGDNQYVMQYDRSEFFRSTTDVHVTHSDGNGTSDMGYNGAQDGNWHHLVFWYDHDSTGDRKRMYVDTEVVASQADPHNGTALGSGLDTYGSIGSFGESRSFDGDEDPRFTGQMSDVRLYERALTEDEINALYQMRSPRYANI